ncbi:sorting nexin-24-like [Dendronephthya gigantea]|uniref:sorting nexin-24-like n=1 Tax=Dendronephthya gigantea TaxID=151771 RepID=UPI001069417A|nr:sorting nexin-24-like [Dendronephthya gigantea]
MDGNNILLQKASSVIKIDIPRFERVIDPTGKNYTVYKVLIAKAGGTKEVEKRYSEFDKLHKSLNKREKIPKNIEFPPKRIISGSVNTKEERRGKLRKFLQELCDLNPIPEEVLAFLGISQPIQSNLTNSRKNGNYSSSEDLLDSVGYSTHQPLLGFTNVFENIQIAEDDLTLEDDVLTQGILDGIYATTERFVDVS